MKMSKFQFIGRLVLLIPGGVFATLSLFNASNIKSPIGMMFIGIASGVILLDTVDGWDVDLRAKARKKRMENANE